MFSMMMTSAGAGSAGSDIDLDVLSLNLSESSGEKSRRQRQAKPPWVSRAVRGAELNMRICQGCVCGGFSWPFHVQTQQKRLLELLYLWTRTKTPSERQEVYAREPAQHSQPFLAAVMIFDSLHANNEL